jgi:hypothetical protein
MDAILHSNLRDLVETNCNFTYGTCESWSVEKLNDILTLNRARKIGKILYHESYNELINKGLLRVETGTYWTRSLQLIVGTYCYLTANGEEYLMENGVNVWE